MLRWRAPSRGATRFVRVQVRRGLGQPAAVTRVKRIRVQKPAEPPAPDVVAEVVRLTNEARAQARMCGSESFPAVGPVVAQSQLAAAAQGHAEDMATQDYFSHDSLDGRTPWDRIRATGYVFTTAGENIAAGYPTPEQVVQGWLESPGHCSNIMNGRFRELGVGHATSSTSRYRVYWVQNFGSR